MVPEIDGKRWAILKRKANRAHLWLEPAGFNRYRLFGWSRREPPIVEDGKFREIEIAIENRRLKWQTK